MIFLCLTGSIVTGRNRKLVVEYDELYVQHSLNGINQTDGL